jgi:putative tryptophan/tyrosine transport system substrate-binding protein
MQFDWLKRRDFITLVGGAAAAWPLAARAQQAAMPVVGLLGATTADGYAAQVVVFRQGLQEAGYREGQNVTIEYRWAENQYERLPELAADLVRRQVAVIATIGGNPASLAAKVASATIPIVFHGSIEPLVASLNRPGGNVTGVVTLTVELGPKRLELLHDVLPAATEMAVLLNPSAPATAGLLQELQAAARTLGLRLHALEASSDRDIDAAFAALAQPRASALMIGTDGFFVSRSEQLATLALRHAVPAIFQYRAFAAAGGLMSYGGSVTDSYRLVGVHAGRILKGEKPSDLPVQQATKVALILNLKTARALGVTMPDPLLARADQVIE